MVEVLVLLGYDPASQGDWFPVFQDIVVFSSAFEVGTTLSPNWEPAV
jgi:hypothetical protein